MKQEKGNIRLSLMKGQRDPEAAFFEGSFSPVPKKNRRSRIRKSRVTAVKPTTVREFATSRVPRIPFKYPTAQSGTETRQERARRIRVRSNHFSGQPSMVSRGGFQVEGDRFEGSDPLPSSWYTGDKTCRESLICDLRHVHLPRRRPIRPPRLKKKELFRIWSF